MSLVVGYADGTTGFLVSDTLLSRFDRPPVLRDSDMPRFHGLKVHVLSEGLAVGYAGDVAAGTNLVADLFDMHRLDAVLDPAHYLGDRLLASRNVDCEFLVLRRTTGWRLEHVSRASLALVQRAYVGDPDEYAKMTALLEPYSPPSHVYEVDAYGTERQVPKHTSAGEIDFAEICSALEALTQKNAQGSVGAICGYVTRVVNAFPTGNLEYLQTHMAGGSPWGDNFNMALLSSNVAPIRGIGLYFEGWQRGLIFVSGSRNGCSVLDARTQREFVAKAFQWHGLRLC